MGFMVYVKYALLLNLSSTPSGIVITCILGLALLMTGIYILKSPILGGEKDLSKVETIQMPVGIKIIGSIYKWLGGVLGFIFSILGLYFAFEQSPRFLERLEKSGHTLIQSKINSTVGIFISIICYILGAGILLRKEWARKGIMLLVVYYVAKSFIAAWKLFPHFEVKYVISLIFGLVWYLWLLYYLNQNKIKKLFH